MQYAQWLNILGMLRAEYFTFVSLLDWQINER